MTENPSIGIGRTAAAALILAMVLVAVGLGTVFSSQGPPVTGSPQTSSPAPVGCFFQSQELRAPSTVGASFTGCLTPGSSGSYLIAATDPNGMTLGATITAQYPIRITIAGASVEGLYSSAGTAYTANDTTSVSPSDILLLPQAGYSVTITNEGTQNNTVTMFLQLNDIPGGRQ